MFNSCIAVASVKEAFQRSRLLLDRDLKIQGDEVGWHQFIGGKKVGIVGSALGILCLKYVGQKSPHHELVVRSLTAKQNKDHNSVDCGGWHMLSSDGMATVEATSWALMGLADEYSADCQKSKQTGLAWLASNQNVDGGWGGRRGLPSRTYATFLACRTISQLDPGTVCEQFDNVRRAKEWILRSQHLDSGWGARPEDPSTAVHSAFAVLALRSLGQSVDGESLQGAIRFISSQWNSASNWEHTERLEQYEIPKLNQGWTRVTFQFFPTAWCIVALMTVGCNFLVRELLQSVTWLLQTQEQDGSWVCPGIRPTRLWIIHDALLALTTFLQKAISQDVPFELLFAPNIAIVYEQRKRAYLVRALALVLAFMASTLIFLGVMLGNAWGGRAPTLGTWAWFVFGSLMAGSLIMAKYKLISWRDVFLVMLIPGTLLVLQIYMGR